ncbi:hypothetical protein ACOMHN_002617 [Nucella lapillus]
MVYQHYQQCLQHEKERQHEDCTVVCPDQPLTGAKPMSINHFLCGQLRMRQYVVVQDGKGRPVVLQEDLLHYVDSWQKKSSLHDSLSTISSRLSKDGEKPKIILNDSRREDTLMKKPDGTSWFRWKLGGSGKSSHPSNSLKSSRSKKSGSGNGVVNDIYAVPQKPGRFGLKRKPSSVKYTNSPQMQEQQSFTTFFIDPPTITLPDASEERRGMRGMEEREAGGTESKAFVGEGMKGQAEREMPLHTLDPSTLPGAERHLGSPNIYDQVMSFRSYASPDQKRKERVVYLYPGGHPGYSHLHNHSHQEALLSDRLSQTSSRSSLVKL